jgi:hypothetical protein
VWWKPHETDNFVMFRDQPWAKWNGQWGLAYGPEKIIQNPGINECHADRELKWVAERADDLGIAAIAKRLKFIGSPPNPLLQQSYSKGDGRGSGQES